MNYRQNIWLTAPLVVAFVLLVVALVLMGAGPAGAEVFPPPLPLDGPPTAPPWHDTVEPVGVELPWQPVLALAVGILMLALAMIPRARRALAEERAKREADRG
jgi:hypothetical protein